MSRSNAVTFFTHGSRRLGALCDAVGLEELAKARIVALFGELTSPWGSQPVGDRPRWASDITDDGTPYEFSLAIEQNHPEIRILVEAQPREPTPEAQWVAGQELSERLEKLLGANLTRLRAIEDLFEVESREARFGQWHAVNVRDGSRPEVKVYLNPEAKGKQRAPEIVAKALARLGFEGAERWLPITDRNQVKYFSLDLNDRKEARVKVYLAHQRTTCAELEAALSVARSYVPGEATEFCRALAGHEGPYSSMALQSCFAFTTSGGNQPVAATLYFPVRAYAESDEAAKERIKDYMAAEDRPLYDRVIDSFADRDLDAGTGMQTYAAFRRHHGTRRVTVYLSPEAYAVGPRSATFGPISGPVSAVPVSGVVAKRGTSRAARLAVALGARRR